MYYPQTKKKKFFQREPDYPCFSVMSATSMLMISRREESGQTFGAVVLFGDTVTPRSR